MADEQELPLAIKSTNDPTGTDQATKGLKETEDAAKSLGDQAKELGYNVEMLKDSLLELAALAEVLAFFKEAAEAAYEHEKALRTVAQAAVISGQDMGEAKKAADEYTAALSEQTGLIKDHLLEAYGKFLLASGDQEEAQARLTLAANIASTGITTLDGAYRLVQGAVNGTTGSFQKMLGVHIQGTTAAEKSANAIAYLEKNYRNVSKATNDAAMEQDRANRRWDEFKETIGGGVLKAMNAVRDSIFFAKDAVILMGKELVEWFETMGKSVASFATFVKNVFTGSGSLQSEYAKYKAESERLDKEHAERALKIEEDAVKKYVDLDKEKLAGQDARVHSAAEAEKKVEKDGLDWYGHILKEKEKLAIQHQKFLDELKKRKDAEDLKEENDTYARIGRENKAIEQKLEMQVKAQANAAKKEEQLEKEKGAVAAEVLNQGISMLGDAFGIQKELSIAQAVINTYEGATKALGQGGIYGEVLAAIVIASGLAQIARIESTQPATGTVSTSGAGFDDPSHDAAAFAGGRKWADDMVSKFSAGVSAGWASGMGASGGSTSNSYHYDQRRTTNVSGVGLVDASSTEMLKKLKRGLDQVSQNTIGPTTIGRAPRQ